jgi:hypothetical protein
VLAALRAMIEKAEAANPPFRAAATGFLKHARETINPGITTPGAPRCASGGAASRQAGSSAPAWALSSCLCQARNRAPWLL